MPWGVGRRKDDGADRVRTLIAADGPNVLTGAELDGNTGELLVPVPGGRARIATGAVVEHASGEPETARAEIVRRWLVDVAAQVGVTASAELGGPPPVESLRVQVSPAWEPDALAAVASSPVATCFDAIITHVEGARLTYLLREHADSFGGETEVASIAVRQTVQNELLDVDVRDHDTDGYRMRVIAKDDCPFVTTALISLARFLPVETADALVIAPRYSMIALVPLTARSEIPIAARLAGVAETLRRDAADPCSGDVYWWHGGVFHVVDIDADGTVSLPPELEPALAGLA